MKQYQLQSGLPVGIQKMSHIDLQDAMGKNTALGKILQTREVRQTLANVLPDVLNVFARDSRIGKFIMQMVGKLLGRLLSRPDDVFEKSELALLFEDETFIKNIGEPLPDIIKGLFDVIATLTKTIEEMPAIEKKEVFGGIMSTLSTGKTGEIITQACRIINDIHKDDPEFFTKNLAPGFQKWIENVDFGELKEMVENSSADARAFVVMINNVLWQYPAKVVLLLSLLPNIVNGIMVALDISLERLNELPPDLLTDVILSYIKEIDAKPIAGLGNQLTELVRKVHTGGALLGEPGSPPLPKLISAKINEIAGSIDPITLWKAKLALTELGTYFSKGVAEAVNDNPALRQLSMIKGPEISNIRMKNTNQKLSYWETVEDDELAKSMANHLFAYDIQEMAEIANNMLRIFNRLGQQKPQIYTELVRQFTGAIDGYELAQAGQRIFNGAGQEIKPLARSVVPKFVTWISEVLAPADDEYEDDAAQAREALRSLFVKEEV
jgi:hypothetical protein